MSQGRACRSVRSARQPRSSTSESETSHSRPTPGSAGESQLVFGRAALIGPLAAQRRVCLPSGGFAVRVTQVVALAFLFSSASAAFERDNLAADSSSNKVLFSASLDLISGKEAVEDHAHSSPQATAPQQPSGQQQFVIERIEFIGNRRIRTDTLKARIFSREGDPYNEETLRRDFQALWNTQFFEDVKLRVEDSPKRRDAKIILFEVKERPQIRRIRYDGIHSISESDILDRFKERKVRSEEHTSELQSRRDLVCRLLLEKKKKDYK